MSEVWLRLLETDRAQRASGATPRA